MTGAEGSTPPTAPVNNQKCVFTEITTDLSG